MKALRRVPAHDTGARAAAVQEHEFEPVRGLPEPLPAGETLLWQGAPDWRAVARQALHLPLAAAYFAVLLLWQAASAAADGASPARVLIGALPLAALALFALGMIGLLAWLIGRTSLYTITDRRLVMRVGIVLTITFNLPFRRIDAAGLRRRGGGLGDIVLTLDSGDRIAYLHLWPHARPWQLKRTQPMLRALPQAERVAELLSRALAAAAGQARVPSPAASVHEGHGAAPGAALAA